MEETNVNDDLVISDIVLTPFENVTATGTITKAERRDAGGHSFAELSIDYINGSEEAKTVNAGIYLGEEGKEIGNSGKEVLIQLRNVTGSSTIKGTVGSRVKFTAKAQKKKPSQGNFTAFSLPE